MASQPESDDEDLLMAFDLDNLLHCLDLQAVSDGVSEGQNLDIDYRRVFGGQILGQFIMAATRATAEKSVKSMHVLFPREGDAKRPMAYHVAVKQSGRTFAAIQVDAMQEDRVVAVASLSLHVDEDGLHRSDSPPAVGQPTDAAPQDVGMMPFEIRVVNDVDLGDRQAGPPRFEFWMRAVRTDGRSSADLDSGEGRSIHQALLAHATDLTIIGTALRPFDGVSQLDSTQTITTAVTSHSIWFHQPFRIDEWLLVAQSSPVVARGRGFGRGDVFTESGELVASFAQESMIRPI